MIPKKIHYCWFGGKKKPRKVLRCIKSWKKYCPDYEIVEWNEDNFDININGYTRMCFSERKWAYLSDYARLYVVANEGGIYFDTDVELVHSFDDLLNYNGFYGFEDSESIATGLGFGSAANDPVILQMLSEYDALLTGDSGTVICTKLNTNALKRLGFNINGEKQEINGVVLLPTDYLNPMDSATGKITITDNTYSIHRYTMSAFPTWKRYRTYITRIFHRFFGVHCFDFIKKGLSG